MNETQRQAYLQAMGIQLYFPRVALPGAKPSPSYQFTATNTQQQMSRPEQFDTHPDRLKRARTEPAVASQASTVAIASNQSSFAEEQTSAQPSFEVLRPSPPQSGQVIPHSHLPSIDSSERVSDDTDELRFRLNYYKISDSLAVINEVPHFSANRESREALTLLRAILRALRVDSSHAELQVETFNWPLAAGITIKEEPSVAAKKALMGFISMRRQLDGFSNLIIFSAQMDELLMPQVADSARDFETTDHSYHMTLTHSLHSMLAYPLLKRDVWSHLQSLRMRLTKADT